MIYNYEGIDSKNRHVFGSIEATNEKEAMSRVQRQGVVIIELASASFMSRIKKALSMQSKVYLSEKETLGFLKELKSVLKTGLSAIDAMEYMAKNTEDGKKFAKVAILAAQGMHTGDSLSDSLRMAGLSAKYCDVLSVGEKAGNIDVALEAEIDQIELSIKIKKGYSTVYVAPAVSATFMLLATIGAIIYLIPMQEKIIYSLVSDKSEIPIWSTVAFWIGDYGVQIIIGFFITLISYFIIKAILTRVFESVALFFDAMALRIPVFGTFYRNAEHSRVCSMLMLSMASGGRQDEVLALIKNQSKSEFFRRKLTKAHMLVSREGYLMSDAFLEVSFNGLIVAFIKRGERADRDVAVSLMKELGDEFSDKSIYNLEILKGASEMINMMLLTILSAPVLLISVAPAIDQVTLMMNRF